jgi:hypothetical protein
VVNTTAFWLFGGIWQFMTRNPNKNFPPRLSQLAFGDGTPSKAFYTAAVVGTILTLINHGDTILQGDWPPFIKIVLTYCVPYCVTTWGAIIGKKAQWKHSLPTSNIH